MELDQQLPIPLRDFVQVNLSDEKEHQDDRFDFNHGCIWPKVGVWNCIFRGNGGYFCGWFTWWRYFPGIHTLCASRRIQTIIVTSQQKRFIFRTWLITKCFSKSVLWNWTGSQPHSLCKPLHLLREDWLKVETIRIMCSLRAHDSDCLYIINIISAFLEKMGMGSGGACAKIQISWWGLAAWRTLNLVLQISCVGDQNLYPRQIVGSSRPLGVSGWLVEPKSKYHHGCKRCKPQIRAFPPTDWGPLVEGGSWGNRTMRGYLKGCLESKSHKSSNESIRHYGEVLSQVRAKLVSQCGLPGLF